MADQFSVPVADEPSGVFSAVAETRIIVGLIALFCAFQMYLAFRLNINWDEYFYLSHVYSYNSGRLIDPFQTFHVHLFGWLPDLPLSEADQIVAGRLVMLLCEIAMMGFLYIVARAFLPARDTLFALLAYCSAGYVLGHGASFRTDPLAAMAMTGALAILFRAPPRWLFAVAAGLAAALGLLVTIKSVLFLPAFGAALLMRLSEQEPAHSVRRIALFFALSAITVTIAYALGWWFHTGASATLADGANHLPASKFGSVAAPASGAFEKTIASQGFFPRWTYFPSWVGKNAVAALALLGGVALAVRSALSGGRGVSRFVPLLLVAPIFSLLFYRNAYPYFYPFILGPVALGSGAVSAWLTRPLYRMAAIAVMGASLLVQFAGLTLRDQSAQRQIAQAVHTIYPDPVAYIDRSGMIPSFPKTGFLMSSWGIEGTLANGRPALAPAIRQTGPKLVIANHPVLESALNPAIGAIHVALPADDVAALRDSYIHHWGPLFVPGKELLLSKAKPAVFTLTIPGRYTLECSGTLAIDGKTADCGTTIRLATGRHLIAPSAVDRLVLRWGDHLTRPAALPPEAPIFHGF